MPRSATNRTQQLPIQDQGLSRDVLANAFPQTKNFEFGIPPRIAPGNRGPTPTSCQGCRKSRTKCVREGGGRVGEEACVLCRRRGIECVLPQEVTRFSRHRKKIRTFAHPTEQSLVALEISAEEASSLFQIRLTSSESPADYDMNRFALNLDAVKDKFHAAGRRFDQLEQSDQISLRIIWSAVATINTIVDPRLPKDRPAHYIRIAQAIVDECAIWRKPSRTNFANLYLLHLTISLDGQQQSSHYLSAASSHFRQLYRHPGDLVDANGEPDWIAYRFALTDAQLALESGSAPLLSNRDYSAFVQSSLEESFRLPSPSVYLSAHSQSLSQLAGLCIHSLRYHLLVAQPVATHFSQLAQFHTAEKDSQTVLWAWQKLDAFYGWVFESMENLHFAYRSTKAEAFALSTLVGCHLLSLLIECTIFEYLGKRFGHLSSSTRLVDNELGSGLDELSSVATLYAQSVARYEGVVCQFLRSARNLNQEHHLCTASEFSISVQRFQTIASILQRASVENRYLFPEGPLDKLASTSFLLENLRGDPNRSRLEESISLLADLQVQLERTTTCPGEQAIRFMISPRAGRIVEV